MTSVRVRLLVMSPSRASSSWRIFSSARLGSWPFSLQFAIENWPKTSQNFNFQSFISIRHTLTTFSVIFSLYFNLNLKACLRAKSKPTPSTRTNVITHSSPILADLSHHLRGQSRFLTGSEAVKISISMLLKKFRIGRNIFFLFNFFNHSWSWSHLNLESNNRWEKRKLTWVQYVWYGSKSINKFRLIKVFQNRQFSKKNLENFINWSLE